jgi:ABC-type multidrug transport system ATPase subunit
MCSVLVPPILSRAGTFSFLMLTFVIFFFWQALCQRLGIMVNGKLQCIGSPQHLKAKFGEGYLLEIRYTSPNNVTEIQAFVAQQFPDATLSESFVGRISFAVPAQSANLSSVFALMEANKQSLGIEDYMFNQPTLEGVFISFARKQIDPDR